MRIRTTEEEIEFCLAGGMVFTEYITILRLGDARGRNCASQTARDGGQDVHKAAHAELETCWQRGVIQLVITNCRYFYRLCNHQHHPDPSTLGVHGL
jgi:hypothetical protein